MDRDSSAAPRPHALSSYRHMLSETDEESDMEKYSNDSDSDRDYAGHVRRHWVLYGGAITILSGFVLLGLAGLSASFGFPHNRPNDALQQAAAPTPMTIPASQSLPRFLKSTELANVVAEKSVSVNAHCKAPGSSQSVPICNTTHLAPFLSSHMGKLVEKMLKDPLLKQLADIMIDGDSQNAIKSATPHLANPMFHTIAKSLAAVLHNSSRAPPNAKAEAALVGQITSKHSATMDKLRTMIFPSTPPMADSGLADRTLEEIFTENDVVLEHKGLWDVKFDLTMQKGHNLLSALESLPNGDVLASILFAPGTARPRGRALGLQLPWQGRAATTSTVPPTIPPPIFNTSGGGVVPLKVGARLGGPPPPDDFAGDIVAALGVPFSHLVMAVMHHNGQISIPFWCKIVMTAEDWIGVGITSAYLDQSVQATNAMGTASMYTDNDALSAFFAAGSMAGVANEVVAIAMGLSELLGTIVDTVYLWTPRGYIYPEGSAGRYPTGFLDPFPNFGAGPGGPYGQHNASPSNQSLAFKHTSNWQKLFGSASDSAKSVLKPVGKKLGKVYNDMNRDALADAENADITQTQVAIGSNNDFAQQKLCEGSGNSGASGAVGTVCCTGPKGTCCGEASETKMLQHLSHTSAVATSSKCTPK